MSRPHDIPQGVWDTTKQVFGLSPTQRQGVARMIMAATSSASLLGHFGSNRNLSLGFHGKVYGDDYDLPTHGNWVVWEETGNINDREWLVRGFGPTPLAALSSAFGDTYVDEYGSTVIHDGRPIDDGDDEPPTGGRMDE